MAVATFEGTTCELRFESLHLTLEHFETALPEYPLEDYARTYPFRYSDEDFPNLSNALMRQHLESCISGWSLQFLDASDTTPTIKILRSMTRGIREKFIYNRRIEKGVQTPAETLKIRRGSCRDFALLMIEAARSLGIAARFVSGYIYTPNRSGFGGGGSTHAWMQAYLPGAGWVDFDPTNDIIGNRNLIRVASGVDSRSGAPVMGHLRWPRRSLPEHGCHRDGCRSGGMTT